MFARANRRFDMPVLIRLTSWGTAAALALMLAVVSSISATGSRRASVAVAALTGKEEAPRQVASAQLVPRASDLEGETRRLNEAIRLLAADRDRLATRVGSLERNLDDMTGSVNRTTSPQHPAQAANSEPPALPLVSNLQPAPVTGLQPAPKTAAVPVAPPPAPVRETSVPGSFVPGSFMMSTTASLPPAATRGWPATGHAAAPASASAGPATMPAAVRPATPSAATAAPGADPARTGSIGTKTEFGVDIGSASDLETLRAMWAEAKTQHGPLLNGLRPVVVVREGKTGNPELRLIVGPFTNASAAARLCAQLGAADILCSAGKFEGQRLALH
jgi:mRNA-degrading endonuclease toxin of MazEF toxin-antitoxin module